MVYQFLKRLIDVTIAAAILLVAAPFMLTVLLVVRRESSGPALYRAPRIGRGGKPFMMLKFRTMVADAERRGGSSTPLDDPRITRSGAFLRRYKLDELPQFINVLAGDMSLVGPRPQVAWAVNLYSHEERRLLSVRPGITDYASLRFHNEGEILRGSLDPDQDYLQKIAPEKTRLGLLYVDTRSLWTDLKILFLTALATAGFTGTPLGRVDSKNKATHR